MHVALKTPRRRAAAPAAAFSGLRVKLIKVDDQGRLDLSRKALMDKPEGYVEPPPRNRDGNRGGRGGRFGGGGRRDNRSSNRKKRF